MGTCGWVVGGTQLCLTTLCDTCACRSSWVLACASPTAPAPQIPRRACTQRLTPWATTGQTPLQALAQDIGLALGCYAHVHSLRRESLGGFSVEDAWPLDVLLPTARKFKSSIKRGLPGG